MLQSKLITLLRSFTREELKRFDSFLLSPYFNQSEKLVKFYRLIEPHHPGFSSSKLEKEKLYAALHGKVKYTDSTMRKLISDLFKLAKAFLALQEFQNNSLQSSALKFRALYNRKLDKLAEAELETTGSLLEKHLPHDENYYYHQWIYERGIFEMGADKTLDTAYKIFKNHDILAPVHSLNRNYLVNFLSAYHYLQAMNQSYKFSLDGALLIEIESLAKPYLKKGDPVIDIYYHVFQLGRKGEESCFFELKALVFSGDKAVPDEVIFEAAIALKNYCAIKISNGNELFSREIISIYQFEVEKKYCFYQGQLVYSFYINIANVVPQTDQLEWADYFIENYARYLPMEHREDTYNYAKAHVLFARKEYEAALRLALSCNIVFPIAKILIHNLVARIHYELGMLDELQTELDKHRHHLKDDKLTDDYRQKFQTFIQVLRQLGELKGNFNREKLEDLSLMINRQPTFASQWWLQKKIKELREEFSKK